MQSKADVRPNTRGSTGVAAKSPAAESQMSNFFSRKPPPTAKEVSKGVKKDVKRSQRDIEREISSLEREEKNLIVEIKKSAQRGNDASTKVLAKQLVGLRKQRERMISSKAHIGAVGMRATAMAAAGDRLGQILAAGEWGSAALLRYISEFVVDATRLLEQAVDESDCE